jgi:uncharacterized membrane protein
MKQTRNQESKTWNKHEIKKAKHETNTKSRKQNMFSFLDFIFISCFAFLISCLFHVLLSWFRVCFMFCFLDFVFVSCFAFLILYLFHVLHQESKTWNKHEIKKAKHEINMKSRKENMKQTRNQESKTWNKHENKKAKHETNCRVCFMFCFLDYVFVSCFSFLISCLFHVLLSWFRVCFMFCFLDFQNMK